MPYREIPPTQVHPLELWSGGVSAEIKIMGGGAPEIKIRGAAPEIKIRRRGAPEKFADPPPLLFKWNSPYWTTNCPLQYSEHLGVSSGEICLLTPLLEQTGST